MSDYHRMSVAEKERHNRQHDDPTRCPECGIAVMPLDEARHVDICEGRPDPGPRSRWVRHAAAVAAGVLPKTLARLAESGKIRTKGEKGQRRYLARDVGKYLADQKRRRKDAAARAAASSAASTLTKPAKTHHGEGVSNSTPELPERLAKFIETAGSYAAASRRLDVPKETLQRAAKGGKIFKATRFYIESRLREVGE